MDLELIPWSLDAQLFCVIRRGLVAPDSFLDVVVLRGVTFGALSLSDDAFLLDRCGKVLEFEFFLTGFLALAPVSSLIFLVPSVLVDVIAPSPFSLLLRLLDWCSAISFDSLLGFGGAD